MWPTAEPENDELFDLLNPFAATGNTDVDAVADDRSIVYATGSPAAGSGRALVLLSFDEAADFSSVSLIEGKGLGNVAHVTRHARRSEDMGFRKVEGRRMEERNVVVEAITGRRSDVRGKEKAVVGCGEKKVGKEPEKWWRKEVARWKMAGRGWIRKAVAR